MPIASYGKLRNKLLFFLKFQCSIKFVLQLSFLLLARSGDDTACTLLTYSSVLKLDSYSYKHGLKICQVHVICLLQVHPVVWLCHEVLVRSTQHVHGHILLVSVYSSVSVNWETLEVLQHHHHHFGLARKTLANVQQVATISYYSESEIWLGKILANDDRFAKFTKVFPHQSFTLYITCNNMNEIHAGTHLNTGCQSC